MLHVAMRRCVVYREVDFDECFAGNCIAASGCGAPFKTTDHGALHTQTQGIEAETDGTQWKSQFR